MDRSHSSHGLNSSYVLITSAYNEEGYINDTIKAVVSQTILPTKWVIVSDGSTDGTDEIVRSYTEDHRFIKFIRREKNRDQGFASKVFALHLGVAELSDAEYGFIGHLDADITFAPSYFSELMGVFAKDPHLGIAGGSLLEKVAGKFSSRGVGTLTSVPGAVQMFRRECYSDIGRFVPIKYGGEDWHAEVSARMKGWQVRTIPELVAYHQRSTGGAAGRLRYLFHQGFMDYALGSHPIFEAAKVLRRIPTSPYVVGAAARWAGFVAAHFAGERVASPEFIHFLRGEQMRRLFSGS